MIKEDDYYSFECPHCKVMIIVYEKELACCIFRHGTYKKDNNQINPHLNKEECDRLYENNLIYGCGKPFEFIKDGKNSRVEICDYI